ncbi:MAG: hypothetical protein J1D77_03710, partial [Muribaculaceae bacterium]|nr:hypothetical protein [Muribaculaceae bacterium]
MAAMLAFIRDVSPDGDRDSPLLRLKFRLFFSCVSAERELSAEGESSAEFFSRVSAEREFSSSPLPAEF